MSDIEEIIENTKERMSKSVDSLQRDLGAIRTGRASTSLVENINVEYYGTQPPLNQLSSVQETLSPIAKKLGAEGLDVDESIARVSLIGAGMKSESGIAAKMFETLGEESININMISTSPIRISCVIDKKNVEKALNILHHAFIETS